MTLSLEERINNYHNTFPNYSKLLINNNVIEGIWVMGNNYKTGSSLYGAYPHGYLKRIIFIHLFLLIRHILLRTATIMGLV